jgi:hypothetical protein
MRFSGELWPDASKNSLLFEIALVLVRLDHVASVMVNADRGVVCKSLTISAKPVGVGAASQPWILAGVRSSLRTQIATTESVSS